MKKAIFLNQLFFVFFVSFLFFTACKKILLSKMIMRGVMAQNRTLRQVKAIFVMQPKPMQKTL